MKTPRKTTKAGTDGSKPNRGHRSQNPPRRDENESPSAADRRRNKYNLPELPPNEHIRKHPDEVYGDTEIPERKEDI